jgi:acetolactate synthase I/II/III large subunit
MAWLDALSGSLPTGSVLVCDYRQVAYVATAAYPLTGPRQLITPGYQGTLGFAFATALGAKIGRPEFPVVALVGDGGFLFTATELATAVQYRIPVITIVFNDGHYGNVKRMQEQDHGGKVIASALTNPDFIRFAESFGAGARRAADPASLRDALRWALRQDGPTVLEVPVGAMPSPWSLLEPSGPAP